MLKNTDFITNRDYVSNDKEHPWWNQKFTSRSVTVADRGGIPLFKKVINLEKKPLSAVLDATSLGIFEIYINGKKVTDNGKSNELKPGWTEYKKKVFYFEFDVADMLCEGENTVIAEVSSGWYTGRISFGSYGFNPPAFACEFSLEYSDGKKERIVTDESWQTAIGGPYRTAEIWEGVVYDSNISREDAEWKEVGSVDYFDGEIVPVMGPDICVREELCRHPKSVVIYDSIEDNGSDYGKIHVVSEKIGDGCEKCVLEKGNSLILDLGQDMVGRPAFTLKAKRGTRIEFLFAELLNDSGLESRGNDYAEGSLYIKNYRSALSRLVYFANGVGNERGEESFAPSHTFYGFRYLEISADDDIEIISVRGEVIGSNNREVGSFECSDEKVNKLFSNILWGLRGNYLSVPTDCPQRDERLGWTGDTQIFFGAGSYLADTEEFFIKWLGDVRDTQAESGGYGDVIPNVLGGDGGNAAWGDAGIIVPYQMYLKYKNIDILKEHYGSMEKYIAFLKNNDPEGPRLAYGDWLSYEETDKRYIADCYYAYVLNLMAKISGLIGCEEKERYYSDEYERIRKIYSEKYIGKDGLTEKTQTAYLLGLGFDLIPEDIRENEKKKLREKIISNDYTLSTGFVGTGKLNQTLSQLDMDDLAYDLLLCENNPSWLYSVNQGATTVWERWNSYTLARGFGDVGMNSFNHYAYGAVAEWMFMYAAGIAPDENDPAFKTIILEPRPDMRREMTEERKPITYVKATYDSRAGFISSSWKRDGEGFVYEFEIPKGSCAKAAIFKCFDRLTVNGKETEAELSDGKWHFDLHEGKYTVRA